uniref:Myb/SANT-like DNA-binding domain-containing protein n=1 Tax=Naja naja TaxID=35670 RepID=A0A8C7E085_NAJNA
MDFRGKKYERGTNWSDPEVVELLHLWADESVQAELESCLRNQHVFNRIAEVLREKGIHRTGDQCREKIKKMKLEYRRIKDNNKAPRGGRTWKFYEVMDRVLASPCLETDLCSVSCLMLEQYL